MRLASIRATLDAAMQKSVSTTVFVALSSVCGLFFASCGKAPVPEPPVTIAQLAALTYGPAVEEFQEAAAVKVAVSAARLDGEWIVLRGSFTPSEKGYHLYSKDMPEQGIDGTGRPTRLDVTAGATQTGATMADKEPHDLKVFDQTLPVYPEGAVTLYRLARAAAGAKLSLSLTYMSCSNELCNAPVEKSPMEIVAP